MIEGKTNDKQLSHVGRAGLAQILGLGGALLLLGCSGSGEDTGDSDSCVGDACASGGAGDGLGSGGLGSGGAGSGGLGSGGLGSGGLGSGGLGSGGLAAGGQGSGGLGTGGDGTGGQAVSTGGDGSGGMPMVEPDPVCMVDDPDDYPLNTSVGHGGDPVTSGHFAIYGASNLESTLNFMEAAHECFVRDWCWRSTGLSRTNDSGDFSKMNIYVMQLNAGGVMQYDGGAGLAFLEVNPNSIGSDRVVVHEFGHALTLTADGWVDQGNTGLWWESIANFVAESFRNSQHCEDARTEYGIDEGSSIINLGAVIGNSHLTMCNNSNQYEAWPFFTYLTNNPDGYDGLGKMIVPDLFANHPGNNETPLHVLELLTDTPVQTILGRYWARMAYVDIGSPRAQERFFSEQGGLNYDNLTSVGGDDYQVQASRRPRYAGANIIPLEVTGDGTVNVQVTNLGNGLPDSNFTATLSILQSDDTVRYVGLPGGTGQAVVAPGEEVSLVVANTPNNLYMYNPSDFGAAETSDPANTGLDYSVVITGAVP